jgi:hypothetical protein
MAKAWWLVLAQQMHIAVLKIRGPAWLEMQVCHLYTTKIEWTIDEGTADLAQVQHKLQALHWPPVALAPHCGLGRDQVAIASCQSDTCVAFNAWSATNNHI